MFVAVAPDHLTTWHVGFIYTRPACMSVRIASHPQICLNQLQLTYKHICSCGAESAGICPYARTQLTVHVSIIAQKYHQPYILQLHLTSSHGFMKCILSAYMSVTISSYQHPCILHLHPTISHPTICHVFHSATGSHICKLAPTRMHV